MKETILSKEIVLYGEESGEIASYKNILDAYLGLKDIKRMDKEENIDDKYYFMYEVSTDKEIRQYPIKIYRRNNKIYRKYI